MNLSILSLNSQAYYNESHLSIILQYFKFYGIVNGDQDGCVVVVQVADNIYIHSR